MSNMRGFDAAQAVYDAMTPPDDGPSECPECDGSGSNPAACEDHEDDTCECCEGSGQVDENGEPYFNEQENEE